jgi:glycosyltransferase involved in cell wall biosynthesis
MTGLEGVGGQPAFSILCSAFRCEDYLGATIDSVVAQTNPDWELIVVDNGMSDEVAEIVQRYRADPRIRLIRQENRKLIGGIAAAVDAATGRYLVPLDSDDQLMPEFCRRMAEELDRHPEIDALSCDAYLFRNEEPDVNLARSFLRHHTGLRYPLTTADVIGRHDVMPYFAAFRRAAWFAAGGYAPGTELVEDIGLFLRLIETGHDVRVLDERLARYRFRDDSLSRDPSTVETFERNREQIYMAAARSGGPAMLHVLDRRLRSLRYEQALRRARWAFLHDDIAAARDAARDARRQRSTPRSVAVLAGMVLAPSLLRWLHPTTRRISAFASRIAARVADRGRRLSAR